MLKLIDRGTAHTCDGVTRRDFMQVGALGAIGLSLPDYLRAATAGQVARDDRACILIFNLGAPSHLDTFDVKPHAPADVRGPFRAIATRGDFQLAEILPRHAAIADKFSIVNSCFHTGAAVHDVGWQLLQTGRQFQGGIETPHVGAAVSFLQGRRSALPPHVVLPETMGRGGGNLPHGQAGGFLGQAHDPVVLKADPSQPNFPASALLPTEIGEARLTGRRRLRETVEGALRNYEAAEHAALLGSDVQDAYRLIASEPARAAFDLAQEPHELRERYGRNRFGQCCLLARRLIEGGVRFVTINTFLTVFDQITWDIHGCQPFTTIEDMRDVVAPLYDQAYSALIEDLTQRGLLDQTLVCNLCEFGRTPKVNAAGGRDHWPQCFTVYFAGGGVHGGRRIGRSDPIGGAPADRPVDPGMVVATIFHSLGLPLDTQLPGPAGRSYPLVDAGTREITELFA